MNACSSEQMLSHEIIPYLPSLCLCASVVNSSLSLPDEEELLRVDERPQQIFIERLGVGRFGQLLTPGSLFARVGRTAESGQIQFVDDVIVRLLGREQAGDAAVRAGDFSRHK